MIETDGLPDAGRGGFVLYLVVCAAPPVFEVRTLVAAAMGRGYDVCLVCTPTAAHWLRDDLGELAALTGHPVRSAYKEPAEPDVLPAADGMLVAPLTFNTLNKWAAGISDTLALGLINEAVGNHLPIVARLCLNAPLAAHPATSVSIATLRGAGVIFHDDCPWELLLDSLPDPV
jgi:Flavoprotein